jgi:Skp family chaperone for outer membrane proteins
MLFFRSFLLILVFGISFVHAAESEVKNKLPAPVIALIDMQRVLDNSLAAKSAKKQIDARRARFQSQTEAEEDELRRAENDLTKSRDHLAADVFADKEQQLRQRFLVVERNVQARRKVLDQAFTDSMNIVRDHFLGIVTDVAKERGINLVLIKQQALWADDGFDVTDEVLDRLNKNLPQVSVKLTSDDGK